MLWKPIHWLLSNCLSFRLCPCPGLSVQTHRTARGDAGNAHQRSRSKAHICSKAEDTQVQRLKHISENGSSAHIGSLRNPKLVYGNIYKKLPPSFHFSVLSCKNQVVQECGRAPGTDWDSAANRPVRMPLLTHSLSTTLWSNQDDSTFIGEVYMY